MFRRSRVVAFVAAFLALPNYLAAQTGTASIRGRLLTEGGQPVGGALVSANAALPDRPLRLGNATLPPLPPTATGPRLGSTTTAADGSFALSGLPAGKVVLCTQVASSKLLDPCHWESRAPTATLAAGQALSGVEIKVKSGVALRVRLLDPLRLLDQVDPSRPRHVMLALIHPRRLLYAISETSRDLAGRTHEVVVPPDTDLRFVIASPTMALEGERGEVVPAQGLTVSFRAAAGVSAPPPVVFRVVRVNP